MTEGAQRRLAAIFVADGVEFARCAEADEPGTLARLQTARNEVLTPTIKKFGGRIFKLTGDGMLAKFASAANAVIKLQ